MSRGDDESGDADMPGIIQLPRDWSKLVDAVVHACQADSAAPRRLVVLLDGGSGAGKTTLGHRLRRTLTARLGVPGGVQLVSLDDCYPGWYGLAQASEWVWQTVLASDNPGYPTWDWQHNRTSGWVPLDPLRPIIVEGCGALTRRSAPLATSRLWYDMPASDRKRRALRRQGGKEFRPWWDAWAAQEQALWAVNRPWELADWIVRGDAEGKARGGS